MSHLLAIAVGPVQEFIAAARRTRDLWFGSYLLSEISRAVAVEVAKHGTLIFPESTTAENVANVILAELQTGEPEEIIKKAKQAAKDCWERFANDAFEEASSEIRKEIWDEQVNDVIEFYAAWVPHNDPKLYSDDRKELMRLLAGRKHLRDFLPSPGTDEGLPKSSLDGQRPTVLHKRKRYPTHLRIREGEQLDIVGMVKRVAGGKQPYPSVSRVAADPWVRGNQGKETFQELEDLCGELPRNVLHRIDEKAFPQFKAFPFEGTAVYVSRHHEWEQEITDEDRVSLSFLQDTLSELPAANPYLAVLVADGDKMGAAISKLGSADEHRDFSRTLAGFAAAAREIVAEHHGVLVYAGGDDVLAFLPVDKCLDCARKLHDDFGDRLAKYDNPTLSIGIAIGHFMENLEDLLEYGRKAERAAKGVEGKDALAVHLHKRGGSPITIASRWETNPEKRLTLYAELMQHDALPGKLPYDLSKLIDIYNADGWQDAVRIQAMQKDALRIIADKQPRVGKKHMPKVREIVSKLQNVKELQQFCDELLIARLLAEVFEQARRQPAILRLNNMEAVA